MGTRAILPAAIFVVLGLSSLTASAESAAERGYRAYERVREKVTYRPDRETTIRPSASGIEIERRHRESSTRTESRTRIEVGEVRRWGDQSSRGNRGRSWGLSFGTEW
jgi:hypothetical protein